MLKPLSFLILCLNYHNFFNFLPNRYKSYRRSLGIDQGYMTKLLITNLSLINFGSVTIHFLDLLILITIIILIIINIIIIIITPLNFVNGLKITPNYSLGFIFSFYIHSLIICY